jgi:CBS domain-containing protein/transposase-like protein
MSLHVFVFVFLLVVCLLFSLALLWRLDWFPLRPSSSQGTAKRSTLPRLLKPCSPDDCPACRLTSTPWSGRGSASGPVQPWREVKSRRGAPKRIPTEGFACPNRQCTYFGNTDAREHALVGDGKHGQAEHIQTFRCQVCRTTFSARRDTPLYRLKTPSHQVAVVLSALAEGLDPSAASRVFGFGHATITTWLTRAGEHAQTLHKRSFCHLWLPHIQLDELRTRLRSHTQVQWLWLAIDPRTKLLPVLKLGPRTQNMAHAVIHSLRQMLAPGCLPLFTSDGLNLYFYAARGSFWTLAPSGSSRPEGEAVAGGAKLDLRSSEEKLSTAQAATGLARHASWNRGRSHSRLTRDGLLRPVEHGFYRAGESDHPPWNSCTGSSHLGHGEACPTAAGQSRVVAGLLSFCASSPIPAGEARAATRTRWQTARATLSAANSRHGSRQNPSTMDRARGALVPLTAGFRLSTTEARRGAGSCREKVDKGTRRRARREPHAKVRWPVWTVNGRKNQPKQRSQELVELSTMSHGSTGIWLFFVGDFLDGIWLGFIGWFLLSAAQSANSQAMLTSLLKGVTVGEVMNPKPATVPADMSLQQLVDAYVLPGGLRCALVMQGDKLVGLITLSDIRHMPRERWALLPVSQVMIPVSRLHVVSPQQSLNDVLPFMAGGDVNQLPVVQDGTLVGVLSRDAIIRYLEVRRGLGIETTKSDAQNRLRNAT